MRRQLIATLLIACSTAVICAQEPFPTPITANQDVIAVSFSEFARIPDTDNGQAPRLMFMTAEPGTRRLFVSTMPGKLYSMDYAGKSVTEYIDTNADAWGVRVQSAFNERGVQSFAFHPQFSQAGAPGYGKFYTYIDTANITPAADFESGGERRSHDTVLLEWTAGNAAATTYDGGAARELFRAAQPFPNHNGGQIAFNPLSQPGDADFGLLYIGLADGGSGGDPLNSAQDLAKYFGKILRIDPLGNNSPNGEYGIPASNPFVNDGNASTLGEIYAYGVRNPQRFNWDSQNGRLLLAEIGQNQVEEISLITAGANLGWNVWEGSYRYVKGGVDTSNPRSDAALTWPIVEYDHNDPLFLRQIAVTGLAVYRQSAIPQLTNKLVFGDNPSGELFYVDADVQEATGQAAIRRILLQHGGENKTLLQVIQAKNSEQGKEAAQRADLRFGYGAQGEIFLLNKGDGVIRLLQ
ncbi:MAG: PQQ-dependent sugar dehydrogenase [Pseudohongiella sp.]|nr:PQQ-dependent sugar dehydrogenase [Pseudohongiella sp.]